MGLALAVFYAVGFRIDRYGTVGTHKFDLSQTHAPQEIEWGSYRDAEDSQGFCEPRSLFADFPRLSVESS